ncbi:hypothetical protein J1N35_008179 [Gossypium stocksii]|uniref:Uncharacterized protein n=1 Tax=Gossypium stocksii TaxID=47602 RepID=A0A9D3W7Y0_9ROSI|nr:hypothetical protein J1N35_008179 [Gossypium stocksii]
MKYNYGPDLVTRRDVMGLLFEALTCMVPMVTTESGLQYKDIKVGEGPSPPVGFQVCQSFDELVYPPWYGIPQIIYNGV